MSVLGPLGAVTNRRIDIRLLYSNELELNTLL